MKISIRSEEFTRPIVDALQQGELLVIWHQIPWAGGAQEWYLIYNIDGLNYVLSKGRACSAFTAYQWLAIPLLNTIDREWLNNVSEILKQELPNEMVLLQPAAEDSSAWVALVCIVEMDDLQEWHSQYRGGIVHVGRIPNLWTGEIVRGYFPDVNGVPCSGPY